MTAGRDKPAPAKAEPAAGDNPGYAEKVPRDGRDARLPHGRDDPPSPEEGGVARDPDDTAPGKRR